MDLSKTVNVAEYDAYIDFDAAINQNTKNELLHTVSDAVSCGVQNVLLRVNSAGGFIQPSIDLYRSLNEFGVEITTINGGITESAANSLYLAGQKRLVTPGAHFGFHGISQTVTDPQTREKIDIDEAEAMAIASGKKAASYLSTEQARELLSDLQHDRSRIERIYKATTVLDEETIQQVLGTTQMRRFDAKQAIELGISAAETRIIVPRGTKMYKIWSHGDNKAGGRFFDGNSGRW